MSKVLITADIHAGVPGRLSDIIFACRIMRQYAAAAGIDTVVILGDLFHDRQALNIEVLTHLCNFLEESTNEFQQRWIVFPGNHDMFLRHSWEINSLVPLRKFLTVIDTVKILQLDEQRFWILPFITFEKSYLRVLRMIEDQYQEGDKLMTHIGIRGATLNTCFLLKDWSSVNFEQSPFRRVYSGHFHSKQQIGENVWYPGSPIPFKFDEGDVPHGFYVYDTEEDTHKFINIWKAAEKFFPNEVPPPQFCTIPVEQLDAIAEEDVRHNIVRVALQTDHSADEKNAIRARLTSLGAKAVRWLNLSQKAVLGEKKTPACAEVRNLFHMWLESDLDGVKYLDRNLLETLNNEVVHDGDELYVVEESDSW